MNAKNTTRPTKLASIGHIKPKTDRTIITANTFKKYKPKEKDTYIRCTAFGGFHIRIYPISKNRPSGRSVYGLIGHLGKEKKSYTLGDCHSSNFETIRNKVIQYKEWLENGKDPRVEIEKSKAIEIKNANKGVSLETAWFNYMEDMKEIWDHKTYTDYERKIRIQLKPLAKKSIATITPQDVGEWLRSSTKNYSTKNALKYASSVFSDLEYEEKVSINPFKKAMGSKKIKKSLPATKKVITHIPPSDIDLYLEAIYEAYKTHHRSIIDIILFMLLTGKRIEECCHAKFSNFDEHEGTLFLEETKFSKEESLVLTDYALMIILKRKRLQEEWIESSLSKKKNRKSILSPEKQQYIFFSHIGKCNYVSNTSRAMKNIWGYYLNILEEQNKKLNTNRKPLSLKKYASGKEEKKNITNHDLRRTYTTLGSTCGYSDSELSDLLNHQHSDSQTGEYKQAVQSYQLEKRKKIETKFSLGMPLGAIMVEYYDAVEELFNPQDITEEKNQGRVDQMIHWVNHDKLKN